MSYPYLIQGDNIVINIDSDVHTINKNHMDFDRLVKALRESDWETVKDVIDPRKTILKYGAGNISIQGDKFFWKDKEMHNAITQRIIKMYKDGFPIDPMVKFFENLMENPSNTAVNELYLFLEGCSLPITPDGHFLAYKKVTEDYKDIYSNTIDNSVGQVVSMERNEVDDERDRMCSYGLHFCSKEYLGVFGGCDYPVMILKINPRDVVSIPRYYNNTKGRCCKYKVVDQLKGTGSGDYTNEDMTDSENSIEDSVVNISFGEEVNFDVDFSGWEYYSPVVV